MGREFATTPSPSPDELHDELRRCVDVVVIVSREDIRVLRYALLVEHVCPGIPLLVTLFDKTVAGEVVRLLPTGPATVRADR